MRRRKANYKDNIEASISQHLCRLRKLNPAEYPVERVQRMYDTAYSRYATAVLRPREEGEELGGLITDCYGEQKAILRWAYERGIHISVQG